MNTFGKTLIVCNMVAAIVVAALFGLTYARSTNWKKKYDDLNDETIVIRANRDTSVKESSERIQDVKAKENETKAARAEKDAMKKEFEDALGREISMREFAEQGKTKIGVDFESLQNQMASILIENKARAETLKESEKAKAALDKTASEYHRKWEESRSQLAISLQRNQNLMKVIQQKEKTLQDLITRGGSGTAGAGAGQYGTMTLTRGPNDPNPPSTRVRGMIEKIDRKPVEGGTLLQLSVGSDHGVNKNNTLDVYRLQPRAEYLGMIVIIDSFPTKSVARMIRPASNSQLREFDIVVDNLPNLISGDR